MKRKIIILGVVLFLFSIIAFFLVKHNSFVYLKNSSYSDIAITHFPNLFFIQQSLKELSQLPLWSNLIFSGYPLSANPLSSLWYAPAWIALFFPLPAGINIAAILHLGILFFGIEKFLKLSGFSRAASIFGGLSMIFSAKLISHFGAGHLTLLFAFSWTPWLFYTTRQWIDLSSRKWIIFTAIVWALIISADPRWTVPIFLLWLLYVFYMMKTIYINSLFIVFSVFFGLFLSAATWLPLFQFLLFSTREKILTVDRMAYSFNPAKILGFFIPEFGGFAEWIVYPSAILLLLFIIGIFFYKENRSVRFWYFAGLIFLMLSFGQHLPGYELFSSIPGVSLLRVPARFLFIFSFCLTVAGAFTLDILIKQEFLYKFDRLFFLTPIIGFILFFATGVLSITGKLPLNLIWALLFFGVGYLIIALLVHKKISSTKGWWIVSLLLVIDLVGVNLLSLRWETARKIFYKNEQLNLLLSSANEYARVYTPSYSVPQEVGAFWNIEQINGIDPMQIQSYVNYFAGVSGIPMKQYSVTLPPFMTGKPEIDNQSFCPNIDMLVFANVQYMVSEFDMSHCGILSESIIDGKFVYTFPSPISPFSSEDISIEKIKIDVYKPGNIAATIVGPGTITLKEIFYPGWKVYEDGKEIEITSSSNPFMVTKITSGEHFIEFVYRPFMVRVGVAVEVISYLLVLICTGLDLIRGKKQTL
ncbi:MAG: hypothetical protein CVU39_02800 [Chloroflexi bacterium HGW-Chloroflexi-10]|nr:MAG: hypothetical protein CVU39_02800 [Chloroflexi bacterium HGW-Chloroflexi-10]